MNALHFQDRSHERDRYGRYSFSGEFEHAIAEMSGRFVGQIPLHELRDALVRSLLMHAVVLTGNNYTKSAKILGVTRQAVQYLARKFELDEKYQQLEKDSLNEGVSLSRLAGARTQRCQHLTASASDLIPVSAVSFLGGQATCVS